jgi:hypothetical protein
LFKLAAVVSAILLVTGFVCYRAGAVDWFVRARANSGGAMNVLVDDSTGSPQYMSGSKSDRIIRPSTASQPTNDKPKQGSPNNNRPLLMPGSKSLGGMAPPPGAAEDDPNLIGRGKE